MKDIFDDFVAEWKKKKDFPFDYCFVASHELQKILSEKNIPTIKWFSYSEEWEWHTFLLTEDGTIIDPTLGQYYSEYMDWFIGTEFPDPLLQKNIIIDQDQWMSLQKERFEKWIYEKIFENKRKYS